MLDRKVKYLQTRFSPVYHEIKKSRVKVGTCIQYHNFSVSGFKIVQNKGKYGYVAFGFFVEKVL